VVAAVRNGIGVLVVSSGAWAAAGQLPAGLVKLVDEAQLAGRIAAWCEVDGTPQGTEHVAVSVSTASSTGEYVVLRRGERPQRLATFSGPGELSCHTPQAARDLELSIRQSVTIEGGVEPRGDATVVCGFTDHTSAVCWQYSPVEDIYMQVGRWST
jgi:hypothetical protein